MSYIEIGAHSTVEQAHSLLDEVYEDWLEDQPWFSFELHLREFPGYDGTVFPTELFPVGFDSRLLDPYRALEITGSARFIGYVMRHLGKFRRRLFSVTVSKTTNHDEDQDYGGVVIEGRSRFNFQTLYLNFVTISSSFLGHLCAVLRHTNRDNTDEDDRVDDKHRSIEFNRCRVVDDRVIFKNVEALKEKIGQSLTLWIVNPRDYPGDSMSRLIRCFSLVTVLRVYMPIYMLQGPSLSQTDVQRDFPSLSLEEAQNVQSMSIALDVAREVTLAINDPGRRNLVQLQFGYLSLDNTKRVPLDRYRASSEFICQSVTNAVDKDKHPLTKIINCGPITGQSSTTFEFWSREKKREAIKLIGALTFRLPFPDPPTRMAMKLRIQKHIIEGGEWKNIQTWPNEFRLFCNRLETGAKAYLEWPSEPGEEEEEG